MNARKTFSIQDAAILKRALVGMAMANNIEKFADQRGVYGCFSAAARTIVAIATGNSRIADDFIAVVVRDGENYTDPQVTLDRAYAEREAADTFGVAS